ncbi:hypothetical protein [Nocardioides sp. GXQ0305]|uniref:hypothetical protein n=1 Tax=Nocardioides sp. GXQ0305 TaxID=3423912 RepID=UPI003D7E0EDB
MTRQPSRTARTAVAVAALLVAAPAAQAASVVVDDGPDRATSRTDILEVRVAHTARRVDVRVTFPDLRRRAHAGLTVYVDSDPDARGPERSVGPPLFSGSDFVMWRMRNWRYVGDRPVRCRHDADYRWRRDVVVLTARRGCFGKPEEVRIGLRMRDAADADHPVTDWLLGRRDLTEWVASGRPT